MDIITLIVFLIGLTLGITTIKIGFVYLRANKHTGMVKLEAKKNHNNRGLNFKKGKIYTFWKDNDHLVYSGEHDNWLFYGEDLNNGFRHIDLYSKFVLNQIKLVPKR